MDNHEAIVFLPSSGVVAHDRLKVGPVVGHHSTSLLLSCSEEVRIGEAAQRRVRGSGDDILALLAKAVGDLAADLLVEQKLHASAACSRFHAASAASASSTLRLMRSSISSG